MNKHLFALTVFCAAIVACEPPQEVRGDDTDVPAPSLKTLKIKVATNGDRPTCDSGFVGQTVHVDSPNAFYRCNASLGWVAITCNTTNAGGVWYSTVDSQSFACAAGSWLGL